MLHPGPQANSPVRLLLSLGFASSVLGAPGLVHGEPSIPPGVQAPVARDPAAAVARFQAALRLLDEEKLDAACDQFEASWLADPTAPVMVNLAECRMQQGKLATAWAWYVRAEPQALRENRLDLSQMAKQRAAQLEPKLSYLTIHVKKPVPGLEVRQNDVLVGAAGLDTPTPVDPGHHLISARADGYKPHQIEVMAGAEAVAPVEIPELERVAPPVPPPSASPAALPPPRPTARLVPSPSSSNPWPLFLGGFGAAVLAVGAVSTLLAVKDNNYAQDNCASLRGCSNDVREAVARRDLEATVATISVPVGVAAIGGATAWWLLSQRPREKSGHRGPTLALGTSIARPAAVLWMSGGF